MIPCAPPLAASVGCTAPAAQPPHLVDALSLFSQVLEANSSPSEQVCGAGRSVRTAQVADRGAALIIAAASLRFASRRLAHSCSG